ncbi:MAG: hypothetical protein IJ422_08110 [Oscillospiraceae bacterium]|nr:hypothetical protein [Oscillospiraceae bacterium]
MAVSKSAKIEAEIEKVKAKIAEQQATVIRFSSFSPFTLPKIFLFLNRIYASVILRPILLAAVGLDV